MNTPGRKHHPMVVALLLFSIAPGVIAEPHNPVVELPRYPREGLIEGLRWSIPLFLVVTAALTVSESLQPRRGDAPVSLEMATAGAISLSLITMDLSLRRQRRRFLAEQAASAAPRVSDSPGDGVEPGGTQQDDAQLDERMVVREPVTSETDLAAILFRLGESSAERGELVAARAAYDELARHAQGSPYRPDALYRAALIDISLGNSAAAEDRLTALIEEYPEEDVTQRARSIIADLLESSRDETRDVTPDEEL